MLRESRSPLAVIAPPFAKRGAAAKKGFEGIMPLKQVRATARPPEAHPLRYSPLSTSDSTEGNFALPNAAS